MYFKNNKGEKIMDKEFLKEMIKNWIEEKGTKSFHWLYRNIENNLILINILNDNISSELIDVSMPQKIYHFYNDVPSIPQCRHCNEKINFFTFARPYNEFCDRKCSQQYQSENKEETNIKRKNTMLERYGVESPMQHQEFKDRYSINSMLNHGVDWVSKDPVVIQKIKNTWAKSDKDIIKDNINKNRNITIKNKYGNHITTPFMVPEIQERVKKIMIEKYGVEYGFQSKEIIDKCKKTNLDRYGYENAMQNDDIQKKHFLSSVSLKEYELPSGKVIKIQGYGNLALDELLVTHNEDNLSIEFDCPKIKYQSNDGGIHYYRPDIYIKTDNMIIEVKSLWFFNIDIEKNIDKYLAAMDQGYNMEFWIYDNGELLEKI